MRPRPIRRCQAQAKLWIGYYEPVCTGIQPTIFLNR